MKRSSWFFLLFLIISLYKTDVFASNSGVSVSFKENRYHVSYKTSLEAPLEDVIVAITNYEKISNLLPSVTKVKVLKKGNNVDLVETHLKSCILFFCKKIINTQEVAIYNSYVEANSLPNKSDFRYSHMKWELQEDNGLTTLTYTAEIEPKFWVPPIFGPKLLKRKLEAEAQIALNMFITKL